VSVPLDRSVYCTGTFTHISVGVFLLMDVQNLGVLETSGNCTSQSAYVRREALHLCPRDILY